MVMRVTLEPAVLREIVRQTASDFWPVDDECWALLVADDDTAEEKGVNDVTG